MSEIFYFVKADKIPYQSFIFSSSVETLILNDPESLKEFFLILEEKINQGYYACGFLSYELGYYLEEKLKPFAKKSRLPLAYFKIYKEPNRFLKNPEPFSDDLNIFDLRFNLKKEEYVKAIEKIKSYIAAGDVYQVNFTFKVKFNYQEDLKKLFELLLFSQRCRYAFYIEGEEFLVLSLSPELFMKKQKSILKSSPMKGTYPRADLWKEDVKLKESLRKDIKNQAENVMIVDLIRNDLGRCCKKGSVYVSELFKVETYPTLHQMISTIKGNLKTNNFLDIIKALFPCGSVTGAPKIRAMEIISELEKEPREVYTGAVGFITPKKDFLFNVAIRTLIFWKKENGLYEGEAGIGSGIVWDSNPEKEYEECVLKAKFFTAPLLYFELIETFYYEPEKPLPLLKYHYKRLKESARYFGFKIPAELRNFRSFKNFIEAKAQSLKKGRYKARLLLSPEGNITLSFSEFEPWGEPLKVAFVKRDFDLGRFFFHKTTRREPLDRWLKKIREKGFHEVIFYNEKGEILEGSISNVYIKINGKLYTPPLGLGILNGVLRRYLLFKKKVEEKVITLDELKKAEEIYIGNALRGLGKVIKWSIL